MRFENFCFGRIGQLQMKSFCVSINIVGKTHQNELGLREKIVFNTA
jgi:hypothetical protein